MNINEARISFDEEIQGVSQEVKDQLWEAMPESVRTQIEVMTPEEVRARHRKAWAAVKSYFIREES